MRKAWLDVKSFVTISTTIIYLTCILLKIDISDYFQTIYVMEIGFYFGTQFQKNVKDSDSNA